MSVAWMAGCAVSSLLIRVAPLSMISRAVIELPRASLGSATLNRPTMKSVVLLGCFGFDLGALPRLIRGGALLVGEEGAQPGDHRRRTATAATHAGPQALNPSLPGNRCC